MSRHLNRKTINLKDILTVILRGLSRKRQGEIRQYFHVYVSFFFRTLDDSMKLTSKYLDFRRIKFRKG